MAHEDNQIIKSMKCNLNCRFNHFSHYNGDNACHRPPMFLVTKTARQDEKFIDLWISLDFICTAE